MSVLGTMYANGLGVPKDKTARARLLDLVKGNDFQKVKALPRRYRDIRLAKETWTIVRDHQEENVTKKKATMRPCLGDIFQVFLKKYQTKLFIIRMKRNILQLFYAV
ncbi:MAG: hypothetical protein LBL95_03390 [Deltaproteobacteria bacterium]|nr:hypothetical protein [Deltaproteobacteria bacterium]